MIETPLSVLIGTWHGIGRGDFPTIDSFLFRETFSVRQETGRPFLVYTQDTDILAEDGSPIRKSHWEHGQLSVLESGIARLVCFQGDGRAETLTGNMIFASDVSDGMRIEFASEWVGNDERVVSSTRTWTIVGDTFHYVMGMATTRVAQPTRHIEGTLTRKTHG